jgi:mRNA interferase RelE/StbE
MSKSEMPAYQVRIRSRRVQREFNGLLEGDYKRVVAKLKAIADNPRPQGIEKLADNIYRIRSGDIRIIYSIDETNNCIEIGGIKRRNEKTYKDIQDLFK